MKTKKLLSVLMAVMMLFGCLGLNASAIDWPKELGAGTAKFRGLAEISSVEIPVDAAFTEVASDAEFAVYYLAEEEGNALDLLNREKVGTLGVADAYVADGVLHLNLKGLALSKEGYYYISVATGALKGTDCQNVLATTDGVLYQFDSLGIVDKLGVIFDFIASIITNLINNGKIY